MKETAACLIPSKPCRPPPVATDRSEQRTRWPAGRRVEKRISPRVADNPLISPDSRSKMEEIGSNFRRFLSSPLSGARRSRRQTLTGGRPAGEWRRKSLKRLNSRRGKGMGPRNPDPQDLARGRSVARPLAASSALHWAPGRTLVSRRAMARSNKSTSPQKLQNSAPKLLKSPARFTFARSRPGPGYPSSASASASPIRSTETTRSCSAVWNTMTPCVVRPAMRMPATGTRMSWPPSVTSMISSLS